MSTRALARWISELRYDDIPAIAREKVRDATLDTFGVSLYGARTQWAQIVRRWVSRATPVGRSAGVWADPDLRARPADAALANGVAAHAFELDDYHNVKLHPGAPVVPAALAIGEAIGASGRDLLTAIVAGYEVMLRSSLALGPLDARLRGWHLTGICGTFGAAAAAASLLKLDAERTAWALGLAGTQSAGVWAFNADGAMSKRLHPGRSAHAGVLAAELAEDGFTGPTSIYETEDGGFLSSFTASKNVDALTRDLGTHYLCDDVAFKPYSCCGSLHSYVDAARALRERGVVPRPDGSIVVGMAHAVRVQCGYDYVPSTVMSAQMSMRYCVAVALRDGQALPPQFSQESIADPELVALAQSIVFVDDAELDAIYPGHMAGWVRAGSGERDRVDVLDPLGSAARPLGRAGVSAKLRGLLEITYTRSELDALEGLVHQLENSNARDLSALLARPGRPVAAEPAAV